MGNPVMATSVCPVCGQRLSSSESVCTECGAILALRMAHPLGASPVEAVTSRFTALSRALHDRRGFYMILALLLTALSFAALAGILSPRSSTVEIRTERSDGNRVAGLDDHKGPRGGQPGIHATRSPLGGSTALGMISATVLGALLCAVSVQSARRHHHARFAEKPRWVGARRLTQAASVGAAFCFGLAAALAVVLVGESRVALPPAALATVQGERIHQWRDGASTPSERPSVLDARLASPESTHARKGEAQQRPTRPPSVDGLQRVPSGTTGRGGVARPNGGIAEQERDAIWNSAAPPYDQANAKPPTADVLRQPPVAAASLGERVWDDVARDWERVRRTVRNLFSHEFH